MQPERQHVWWKRLLALAVTVLALIYVSRRVDLQTLREVLSQMHWPYLVAALGLYGMANFFAACRWHMALRVTHMAVHPGATGRALLVGQFLNLFLFGPMGGDVARSGVYSRWYRLPFERVLSASPLDGLLGLSAIIIITTVALSWALLLKDFARGELAELGRIGWLVITFGALLAGVIAVINWAGRRQNSHSMLHRFVEAVRSGLGELRRQPKTAAAGLAASLGAHLSFHAVLGCGLTASGAEQFSWSNLFWLLPIINLLASLPSVGGLGLREGAALTLLGPYGISPAHAVAGSLVVLAGNLFWSCVGASVWAVEERKFRAKRPEESSPVDPQTISVVIPTLNEAEEIEETVRRLRQLPEVSEIIEVDGGSQDATREKAAALGCRVLEAPSGRGRQLRQGAQEARGEVVLLLHADTWVSPGAGAAVLASLRDVTVVGGGFWKKFRAAPWLMRGSRFRCGVRLFLGGRLMGDQGVFVRREVLEKIGGVPDLPLMEELELCRHLRGQGRLALAGATVSTSARRFARRGILRAYARMWRVMWQYRLGTPAARLRDLYERD